MFLDEPNNPQRRKSANKPRSSSVHPHKATSHPAPKAKSSRAHRALNDVTRRSRAVAESGALFSPNRPVVLPPDAARGLLQALLPRGQSRALGRAVSDGRVAGARATLPFMWLEFDYIIDRTELLAGGGVNLLGLHPQQSLLLGIDDIRALQVAWRFVKKQAAHAPTYTSHWVAELFTKLLPLGDAPTLEIGHLLPWAVGLSTADVRATVSAARLAVLALAAGATDSRLIDVVERGLNTGADTCQVLELAPAARAVVGLPPPRVLPTGRVAAITITDACATNHSVGYGGMILLRDSSGDFSRKLVFANAVYPGRELVTAPQAELDAISFAINAVLDLKDEYQPGDTIIVHTDSTAAAGAVRKGGSPTERLHAIAAPLAKRLAEAQVFTHVLYIQGDRNTLADQLSRGHTECLCPACYVREHPELVPVKELSRQPSQQPGNHPSGGSAPLITSPDGLWTHSSKGFSRQLSVLREGEVALLPSPPPCSRGQWHELADQAEPGVPVRLRPCCLCGAGGVFEREFPQAAETGWMPAKKRNRRRR